MQAAGIEPQIVHFSKAPPGWRLVTPEFDLELGYRLAAVTSTEIVCKSHQNMFAD